MTLLDEFLRRPALPSTSLIDHCLEAMRYYTERTSVLRQYGSRTDLSVDVSGTSPRPGEPDKTRREVLASLTGMERTDCITGVLNVLKYGYSRLGQTGTVTELRSSSVSGALGTKVSGRYVGGLAQFLVSKGWRAHFWCPDSYDPRSKDTEHTSAARVARTNGTYYDVPLSGKIVDYNLTTKFYDNTINNTYLGEYSTDLNVFRALERERLCVGINEGGMHTFLLTGGNVWEVHWDVWRNETPMEPKRRPRLKDWDRIPDTAPEEVKYRDRYKRYVDVKIDVLVGRGGAADAWHWLSTGHPDCFKRKQPLYEISPFIDYMRWLSGLLLTPPESTFSSRPTADVRIRASVRP